MRLAGQTKAGFFPAPPEAIAAILRHLKPPPDPPPSADLGIHIIDPCAGESKALADIRRGLASSGADVHAYAVELNASRADRIREAYPDVRLLGPCSFHATDISSRSFGLLYLNPPFDNEFGGGGREESSFLTKATWMLAAGGVLVFVLPYNQVLGRSDMITSLDLYYEDLEVYLFPDDHRPYRECAVIGVRRRQTLPAKQVQDSGVLHGRRLHCRYNYRSDDQVQDLARLGEPQFDHWGPDGNAVVLSRRDAIDTWTVPYTAGPRRFAKTDLTAEEIEQALARSPLHRRLRTRVYAPARRPPLPLNRGHTSLMLLTGLLDGYVPSDPPHVVRGYCGKESKLVRTERYDTPAGTHVEKRISAEQPNPVVRAVWPDGKIHTFSEKKPSAAATEEFTVEEQEEADEDDAAT